MRATDIVRRVLDLLDAVDSQPDDTCQTMPAERGEPIASRFKQIFAMLDNPNEGPHANSPNEVYSDIESVTTDAGGGLNGPKHPHDIRVKDPSAYPDQQEKF